MIARSDNTTEHLSLCPNEKCDNGKDSSSGEQLGVQKAHAAALAWTPATLCIAYLSVVLLTSMTALQGATVSGLTTYVTSQFSEASKVATITTITSIMYTVMKPPMTKIADVFGRVEAFLISILLYTLGLCLMAVCTSFGTYAAAQIFSVAGSTGLSILIIIFLADTTSLLNRALFIVVPNLPYLWTWVAGPSISGALINKNGEVWRWGFGMFCILIPATFLPLGVLLVLNQIKMNKLIPKNPLPFSAKSIWQVCYHDLDMIGLILLTAGLCCWLLPFTLAGSDPVKWKETSNIVLSIVGPILLLLFVLWSIYCATNPIMPLKLLKNKTVLGASLSGAFYFAAFYLWDNYFYTFMLVAKNQTFEATGRISQTFDFSSTFAAVSAGVAIKYLHRAKILMIIGVPIYVAGIILMVLFRKPSSPTGLIIFAQVVVGIGAGIFNYPAQAIVQAATTHNQVAAAITMYLTALPLGGAVGSSMAGALWEYQLPKSLSEQLPYLSDTDISAIVNDYTIALSYPWGSETRNGIVNAYSDSLNLLCIVGACVAVLMVPGVLMCSNVKFKDAEKPDAETEVFVAADMLDQRTEIEI